MMRMVIKLETQVHCLPWEKNNFNGAFEMKSENGNFGIRIEVQRGRTTPY